MTDPPLLLAEATPAQLAARLRSSPVLLLPIGTIEYHGDHAPLGLDGIKAESIARDAGERTGAVLAPTSWWAADGVPGEATLRLPATVVAQLLEEALVQFASMGFRVIVLVNGHCGLENSRVVRRVALSVMERATTTVLPIADYEVLLELGNDGDHAGHWETSLLLAARPDLVHLDAIPAEGSVDGVIGADPRQANDQDGNAGIAHAGARVAAAVKRALTFTSVERDLLVAALTTALGALDVLAELRRELPRDEVPAILTSSWREHLRAMDAGNFEEARRLAEQKHGDPTA